MKTHQNAQNALGQLGRAVLFTVVIAMVQPAKAESFPVDKWSEEFGNFLVPEVPLDDWWFEELRAYPVPEEQQSQAIQSFYTTQTDLAVLEQAMQVSGLPLNQLEIASVVPVTWPDGCIGFPGICTQALVRGWIAVVSDGERSWAYHTSRGHARLNPALSSEDIPLISLPEIDWPSVCWDDVTCRNWLWDSGLTQETPVMPERNEAGTWVFEDAPTRRWFDPPITPGFTYAIAGDGYFSDILDFPTGIDTDNQFTVTVAEQVIGQFSPGERVNFLALLGSGVQEFTVSDIDASIDVDDPLAFPLKLGFTTPTVDGFTMTPLPPSKSVPEPSGPLGTVLLGALGWLSRRLSA